MDKKSKEVLRRYKKTRQQDSSDSSSSESGSSSSSYSSSDSEKKRHRKKKVRQPSGRRSSSSSGDERRKREKREHCQKKLEAKRIHLKRKLKEAKLKKRAAAAAAALSGHSHRALSPATQAKLKKLAERKHQRAASKERREREREKHRAAAREREREQHRIASRSPTKITKIRIHQDVKRQKTPPRMHHQLMSREKIIIQTRTRDRTPSAERERLQRLEKMRHEELMRERERRERDRERAEREAARDKERAEALARCQERQRERERLAREKLRREEEEKKYGPNGSVGGGNMNDRGDRLLPRPGERDLVGGNRTYNSRERSLEHGRHIPKRDIDVYDREREYMEVERRGLLDRDELAREREFMGTTRRRELSPIGEHYAGGRMRGDPREVYPDEERERPYNRGYLDDARHPRERDAWMDPRDIREREMHDMHADTREFREHDHDLYTDERERLARERERTLAGRGDWKNDWESTERGTERSTEWEDIAPVPGRGGFVGGPKRAITANTAGVSKLPPVREQRASSEPDWDADEMQKTNKMDTGSNLRDVPNFSGTNAGRDAWVEHDQRDLPTQREKLLPSGSGAVRAEHGERRWQSDWRENEDATIPRGVGTAAGGQMHHGRGGRGFRRGGGGNVGGSAAGGLEHGERNSQSGGNFRPHPPPLMTLPVQPPLGGGFHGGQRFPNKRNMTYTNPNLIKKQQAALSAAKMAAQASAVAAASTAVAAAKAAAQSAANATTNPGILGQVSAAMRLHHQQHQIHHPHGYAEQKQAVNDAFNNKLENETIKLSDTDSSGAIKCDDKVSGELSEISDSDDEILNKAEKKSKADTDEATSDAIAKTNTTSDQDAALGSTEQASNVEERADDDEMLDFEEISDGELEEDARNKGVGDALGVDWASLIAETKRQAENSAPHVIEEPTTAKQKWQPHRVILDIGISMRMAGEDYAKRLLTQAKQKLDEELGQLRIKSEIKDEVVSTADEDSQMNTNEETDENTNDNDMQKKTECKSPQKSLEELNESTISVERLHAMACIQVAQRVRSQERRKLITNACGSNSRALSARQDLKLRRQLCGLPARECDFPRQLPATSEKLKSMALAAFQRALEVK